MDIFYWEAYGDEGKIKYALYEKLENNTLQEYFRGRRTRPAKQGDMHTDTDGNLYLSQQMVSKISEILLKYGTLTPVEVKNREEPLYRYDVTNELNCIIYEKSVLTPMVQWRMNTYKDSIAIALADVIKPCIDLDKYNKSMIFKIVEFEDSTYFVTKEFINLVEKYNLKGFKFYRCNPAYNSADKDCKKQIFLG